MVTTQGRVDTDRASRYLVQLCQHAGRMGGVHGGHGSRERPTQVEVDYTDTTGTITLTPWGRCALRATPEALVLEVEASDTENLGRVQALLGANLTRFGRRDQLAVTWESAVAPPPVRRRRTVLLAGMGLAGLLLVIAMHLGVGAVSVWLGWTAAGLVVTPILLVAGHIALPVVILRLRRRTVSRSSGGH